jgi:hypothetical protein
MTIKGVRVSEINLELSPALGAALKAHYAECILIVLFTILRNSSCSLFLITSQKCDYVLLDREMSTVNVTGDYGVNESTVFFSSRKTKLQSAKRSRSVFNHVSKNVFFLIHRDNYLARVQRTWYAWMENEDGNSRSIRKECE